jgi:DNA helicase-2/ATP-dependent DNA helicase PcrA
MKALAPLEVDLGGENHRSPGTEIVKFGNDILENKPRGAPYIGVSRLSFAPLAEKRDKAIRSAVGLLCKRVNDASGKLPKSIGYLTSWGKGVVTIARSLQGGAGTQPVAHRVVMDEAEVLLAARVIAVCLEPVDDISLSVAAALDLIRDLYRARGDVTKAAQLARCADDARRGKTQGASKCPKGLRRVLEDLRASPLSGNPSKDWLTLRHLFEKSGVRELELVAHEVIYLMGFNRGRRIADSLAEVWQRYGRYENSRVLIEAAINEDQIVGSEGSLTGINVMTIHKSKGKEFDGVIILHLGQNISPLSPAYEQAPHAKSRRLLRVAVTRARHHVIAYRRL